MYKLHDKIREQSPTQYDDDTLRYLYKSNIAKGIYKSSEQLGSESESEPKTNPNQPKKRALPTDRLVCKYCNKEYFRSGSTRHKRTVYHRLHENLSLRIKDILISNE